MAHHQKFGPLINLYKTVQVRPKSAHSPPTPTPLSSVLPLHSSYKKVLKQLLEREKLKKAMGKKEMGDDLFQDLPPPSSSASQTQQPQSSTTNNGNCSINSNNKTTGGGSCGSGGRGSGKDSSPPSSAPPPALKSALKRSKPSTEPVQPLPEAAAPERRIRFKTTTDASEAQVIEAMQKIASHIKNPSKFSKASKLAIQLIQAGSVKPSTSDQFIAILAAAMSSPTTCNEPSVRADYHALFSAAEDTVECLSKRQKNQLTTWTIRAVLANDLFTDDSFVFSKATGKIKEAISSLPVATTDDDVEEAEALKEETEAVNADVETKKDDIASATSGANKKEEADPFGLDALIPSTTRKDEKVKLKRDAEVERKEEEEETKRFLKAQRVALITCLEIAAKRYKVPWCQTAIDILVKHAFDNVSRFTTKQRGAIDKLWASVREQQTRRKQGKSVTGKLDVNAFEWLQQKYANEKISIRHSVGASGDRHCEQWLG